MESASSSIRSSGRKLKRKTFDDFVSTSEWQSKTRKRLSIENPDVLPKFPKVEDEIQDTLQNPTISDNGNQSPSHKSVKKDDTNTETTTCGSQEKPKNDSVKDEAAANIRELPKRTKTLTSVKKNIQAARQKFDKKNKKESIVKDTVTSQSKSDVQGNARTLKEEREFAMKHSCKKSGCGRSSLTCCIKATKTCMEASGKSSRWYHMSLEEHYCNGCFDQFYRVKNSGCEDFHEWKRNWMQNSKADASFKNLTTYISEKQLPFWVRCVSCGHWRSLTNEVELTPNIVKTYKCIMGNLANTLGNHDDDNDNQRAPHIKYSCSADNDPCVETAVNPDVDWMHMLSYTPFLKNSPAAPFLTGYYPDGVGMSAVDTVNMRHLSEFSCEEENVLKPPSLEERIKQWSDLSNEQSSADESCEQGRQSSMMMSPGGRKHGGKDAKICVDGLNPYFQPFYKPHERGKALCMRPDVMELDEADEFPEFYKEQTVYLAVRNLVVALWTLQPRHALTVEDCCQHLITRSLTRARLCQLVVPRVLHFAVRKGLVNSGVLGTMGNPRDHMLPAKYTSQKVLVVGAGPAGLAAARQLHNFGCDVTVVEARDRVGGRVHDDWTLDGVCVGRGAQIINGCVNNPLALISHQLDLKLHVLRPRCDLYDGSSEVTTRRRQKAVPVAMETDKRMDFHFNALLDIIVEWRQAQDDDAIDCSLGDKIAEAHQEWISQSGLSFSKLEERILDFHTGNLEFACGASLDKVSAFHWDQNEIFAQFSGDHAFVAYGFGSQLEAMAEGLDVRLNSPVSSISYNDSCAEVRTVNGECLKADRVVVSVPLAVLRSGSIEFKPPLPKEKTDSMNGLGCGCIEKIALLFPHRFWDKKTNGANYFGYIPANETNKGFCTVFYDIPQPQGGKSNVLMSVISGDSAERARNMSEERIKDVAISILATVFPEQEIPQPTKWFVTRWRDDKYAQMAYSYVRTGSSGDDYDVLAKQVGTRLFFAGEGTNRHFPQTVTGAYLSGLREAAKIAAANIS